MIFWVRIKSVIALSLLLLIFLSSPRYARADEILYLRDPVMALGSRVHAISEAKKDIFLSTYLWAEGLSSDAHLRELLRALERGVRVRIAVDGSTFSFSNPAVLRQLRYLQEQGAEIHQYNGFQLQNWKNILFFWQMLQRSHDKIVLVDGRYVSTGSRNIWDNSFELGGKIKMSEMDTALRSNRPIQKIIDYVEAYWKKTSVWKLPSLTIKEREDIAAHLRTSLDEKNVRLKELYASPAFLNGKNSSEWRDIGSRWQFVWDHRALYEGGENHIDILEKWLLSIPSGRNVRIASPWLVFTPRMKKIFDQMLERGVTLEFFLNSELTAEYMGGLRAFEKHTLPYVDGRQGVKVHLFTGQTIHYKFATDGFTSYIGAYNMGFQSERRNTETGLLVENIDVADHLENELARLRSGSADLEAFKRNSAACRTLLARITSYFF